MTLSTEIKELDGIYDEEKSTDNKTTLGRNKESSGCHVSIIHGFLLTFLALAIAVMVGVIVTFAGNRDDVICSCKFEDTDPDSSEQVQCPTVTTTAPVTCPNIPCPKCPTTTNTTSSMMSTTSSIMGTTSSPAEPESTNTRLPTSLIPLEYDVVLRPDIFTGNPATFKTTGQVKIIMFCNESTSNITVHINKINVTESSVKVSGIEDSLNNIGIREITENTRMQFLIIHLNTHLQPGKHYSVEMDFAAPLKKDLLGLYYSDFQRNGKPVYLAMTYFAPTSARKAFPSFDEPGLKATFNITLERKPDNGYITLSNMHQIGHYNTFVLLLNIDTDRTLTTNLCDKREFGFPIVNFPHRSRNIHVLCIQSFHIGDDPFGYVMFYIWSDGWVGDVYKTTVKMSTYLLAFIVCDFSYKEIITRNGTLFRTFAQNEDYERMNFSLDIGSRQLDAFEDYFEIPYSLEKLDMIAIPDFWAGGMENWGLVTYRSKFMLYDKLVTTPSQQKMIAEVIAHELSHMWFGNLISPFWWDDLWLNEGFATFFSYLGMDFSEPSWKVMDHMGVNIVQVAFRADSLASSRPIFAENVNFPDDIYNLFDAISYLKGASVIRMLWNFLGPETLRKGLSRYLRNNMYGSVTHGDLWTDLTQDAAQDGKAINVKTVMDTWVLQRNYPVIYMSRNGNDIKVTQTRFVLGNVSTEEDNTSYKWEVPFTFTTSTEKGFNSSKIIWIHRDDSEKTFPGTMLPPAGDSNGWIIGNLQQLGYYRVNYDESNWRALINQLKNDHTVIHPSNRAEIMDDMWAFVSADIITDIQLAISVFDYLTKEESFVPWYAAIYELNDIDEKLRSRAAYGLFEKFMRNRLSNIFHTVGLTGNEGESMNNRLLRSSIAKGACQYNIENCTTQAVKLFNAWIADPSKIIDPDVKETVYCTGIKESGSDAWDITFARLANSSDSEKAVIRSALACSGEHWILYRYLEYALDETKIRKQDITSVILAVGNNPIGQYTAWKFVVSRWRVLVLDYQLDQVLLNSIVTGLTKGYYTDLEKRQVEFLEDEHPAEAPRLVAFSVAKETIDNNKHWEMKHYNNLFDWLQMNA